MPTHPVVKVENEMKACFDNWKPTRRGFGNKAFAKKENVDEARKISSNSLLFHA
jgi:hypothetical protein